MKNYFKIILALLFFSLNVRAQEWKLELKSNVSLRAWKLSNKAESDENPLPGATIKLLKGSSIITQVSSNGNGDFTLLVPPNDDYTIEVSYSGCNTKRFAVSTQGVPIDVGDKNYSPSFSIRGFVMAKPYPGIDYSSLGQTLVKVVYFSRSKTFNAEESTTKQGLSIVSQIFDNENALFQKFCSANKSGDDALAKPDCPLAKTFYEKAQGIIAGESYPSQQLSKVNICLQEKDKEAALKAQQEKEAAEKAEAERLAKEKALADKAEADRLAKEQADQQKAQKDKEAAEKAEADRMAKEKALADKAAADKLAKEQADQQKAQKDKEAAEKAEAERLAKEKALADKAAADKLAKEQADQQKVQKDKEAAEKTAADKLAKEKDAQQKALKEKEIAEKTEADKLAKQKDKEEKERLAKEKEDAKKASQTTVVVKETKEENPPPKNNPDKETGITVTSPYTTPGNNEENKINGPKRTVRQTLGGPSYKDLVTKADWYLKTKQYKEAKAAYEDVLNIKANDPYATGKLAEIQKILTPQ